VAPRASAYELDVLNGIAVDEQQLGKRALRLVERERAQSVFPGKWPFDSSEESAASPSVERHQDWPFLAAG